MQNSNIRAVAKWNPFTDEANVPELSDKELYEKCRLYGTAARMWRQKFIGLLPEVNRRRLYEKKGFSSVFEFAFKLCGLSAEQVRLALNLEKRFEDKPVLKKMLENGEASINKLTRIASIATPENEGELAEKIKVLPVSALNTLVRDEKYLRETGVSGNDDTSQIHISKGLNKPLFEGKCLYVQTSTLNFELADDIKQELNELHSKGVDVNELLQKMLKRRREKIEEEKEDIALSIRQTEQGRPPAEQAGPRPDATRSEHGPDVVSKQGQPAQRMNSKYRFAPPLRQSRYISVRIKKILKEEYGEKCSIVTCKKPAVTIHHTQRFSLSQNHDPRFLAPLCHEHHAIAHSIDLKYHRARKSISV